MHCRVPVHRQGRFRHGQQCQHQACSDRCGLNTIPMPRLFVNRYLLSAVVLPLFGSLAFGHIRIAPTESTAGAREKYTMRVPNEKQVPCSKIKGEFPSGLDVYDFEFKPGWKIDFKRMTKARSSAPPGLER